MKAQTGLDAAWSDSIHAAFEWWSDAGVDCDFRDEPQDWLVVETPAGAAKGPVSAAAAARKAPEPPPPPLVGGGREQWPTDLADFAGWWLEAPDLAPAGFARVPPTGPAGAELMVVVAMPGAEDGPRLLDGRAGQLLDGFLAAAGLMRDSVYVASALPARIAMPDWGALAKSGLGDLLRHHVALVVPRRVLLLGQSGISTLLGHDSTHKVTNPRLLDQGGTEVPALTAYDLDAMLARPGLKAGLWARWLDWTGPE